MNSIKAIKPASPIIPTTRSFPPLMGITEIEAVAFIVPCKRAAAITDFDLIVK